MVGEPMPADLPGKIAEAMGQSLVCPKPTPVPVSEIPSYCFSQQSA